MKKGGSGSGSGSALLVVMLLGIRLVVCQGPSCQGGVHGCQKEDALNYNFNYAILSLQWEPSVLKLPFRSQERFTIHGLWPTEIDCDGPSYTKDAISSIESKLHALWPDSEKPGDDSLFWEKQWNKHGKCSGLPQLAYFQLALELYDKVHTTAYIRSAKIKPGESYSSKFLINSYYIDSMNVIPKLKCRESKLKEYHFNMTISSKTPSNITSGGFYVMCPKDENSKTVLVPKGTRR